MPKTLKMLKTYVKDKTGSKVTFRQGTVQKLRDPELEAELLAGGYAEDVNSKKKPAKDPLTSSKKPAAAEPKKGASAPAKGTTASPKGKE